MKEKKCFICGAYSNGIIIKGKMICSICEKKASLVKVTSDEYKFYVNKIRDILFT